MNWSAGLVAEVPEELVTLTSTVPAARPGRWRSSRWPCFSVKPVAAVEPKCTALTLERLVPVMVTEVPPALDPEAGLTPVTVGTPDPVACWQFRVPESSVPPPTLSKV